MSYTQKLRPFSDRFFFATEFCQKRYLFSSIVTAVAYET